MGPKSFRRPDISVLYSVVETPTPRSESFPSVNDLGGSGPDPDWDFLQKVTKETKGGGSGAQGFLSDQSFVIFVTFCKKSRAAPVRDRDGPIRPTLQKTTV